MSAERASSSAYVASRTVRSCSISPSASATNFSASARAVSTVSRAVARVPLAGARTVATTALVLVGLYLLLALEATSSRRAAAIGTLSAAMLFLYALVLAVPGLRHFFALTVPGPGETFVALAGAALAVGGLLLTDDRFVPGAFRRTSR